MTAVLRIQSSFSISGRGRIHVLRPELPGISLRVGDVLYDLLGRRHEVAGIVLMRRISAAREEDLIPLLLRPLDGAEPRGGVLTDRPGPPGLLFCSEPFAPNTVDSAFAEEYETCRGRTPRGLFSYEDLTGGGTLTMGGEPLEGLVLYRGWMLRPEQYRALYRALLARGIVLVNSPEEYDRCQLLPRWYDDFRADTAPSVWIDGTEDIEGLMTRAARLGRSAVVKDHVKSRKYEWYDACFIRDLRDRPAAEQIVRTFLRRQGEDLVGGVVLRAFLPLRPMGLHSQSGMPLSEEYRIFGYAGEILTMGGYWRETGGQGLDEDDLAWLRPRLARVGSNFFTMDAARRTDGSLVILELGDGQVSGLQETPPEVFFGRLFRLAAPAPKTDGTNG